MRRFMLAAGALFVASSPVTAKDDGREISHDEMR